MKHLLIILAIALTVASCELFDGTNPPTHDEIIHQMMLDTLGSIPEGGIFMIEFLAPDSSLLGRIGDPENVILTPMADSLLFLKPLHRLAARIPYEDIAKISTTEYLCSESKLPDGSYSKHLSIHMVSDRDFCMLDCVAPGDYTGYHVRFPRP